MITKYEKLESKEEIIDGKAESQQVLRKFQKMMQIIFTTAGMTQIRLNHAGELENNGTHFRR